MVRGKGRDLRLGPDSVGFEITRRALCFGGNTLTLTDVAVANGMQLGDRSAVLARVSPELAAASGAAAKGLLAAALDRMRTTADPVTVIAVGGGSFLVPEDLPGALEVLRPPHHEVANAVGAAIAEVSGEVDRIFRPEGRSRQSLIDEAREEARARAVECGAIESTVRDVDLEEIHLAYLPGDAVRIRARAAGKLDIVRRNDPAAISSTAT